MRRPHDSTTSAWIWNRISPAAVTNGASHGYRTRRSAVASGTSPGPGRTSSSSLIDVTVTEPTTQRMALRYTRDRMTNAAGFIDADIHIFEQLDMWDRIPKQFQSRI